MHLTDNETGEVTNKLMPMDSCYVIDMETGEVDSNIKAIPMRKTTFIIPKELIQAPKNDKEKLCCMDSHVNYTLTKKEEVISLQEVIITI